jgi:bifunctional non-homologous end joining protein LigD
VIGGITEGTGSRKYFGALMLGVYENGRLRYVDDTVTGFFRFGAKSGFW